MTSPMVSMMKDCKCMSPVLDPKCPVHRPGREKLGYRRMINDVPWWDATSDVAFFLIRRGGEHFSKVRHLMYYFTGSTDPLDQYLK